VSRSRIKRLKGVERPQFRLRVEDVRVFYDVSEKRVEILAIVLKEDAEDWLAKVGRSR
jgi:mRNA-degrading endonuclease RelE of RelBE toxin-antitoxin system